LKYFKSNSTEIILSLIILFSICSIVFAQEFSNPFSKVKGEMIKESTLINKIQGDMAELQKNAIIRKKIFQTVGTVVVAYLLLFLLVGIVNKRVADMKAKHVMRKNVVYLINFFLLLFIFFIWVQNINSLTIFLGFASAGLALALQEVILSIAGWFLILVRRPFEVGDRVEINGVKGDIIDIRLFQVSLLEIGNWVHADQSTGRIVNVPNSYVFKYPNFNYSRGFEFIWNEIPILVTFESDWQRGKEIMMSHAKSLAEGLEESVQKKIAVMRNRYMIYYGKLSPIVYVNIKDSGVELTLRYLTESKKRRSTQDELSQKILADFGKEKDVNFAYPTYRIVKS